MTQAKLIVNIDTSRLSGKQLMIKAEAFSNGEEQNIEDNKIINVLELIEYSEVEIQGQSSMSQFAIEDQSSDPMISHEIEILNQGPSTIRELSAMLFIPTWYQSDTKDIKMFNRTDLYIQVYYKDSLIPLTWYHDNQLLDDTFAEEISTLTPEVYLPRAEDEFDIIIETEDRNTSHSNLRSKRTISVTPDTDDNVPQPSQLQRQQTILDELPPNRTIHFNCKGSFVEKYSCMQIYFHVNNFQAGGKDVIKVKINYILRLHTLNQVFDENLDIFAMHPLLELNTNVDNNENAMMTFKITQENLPSTIIFKHFSKATPLWIYITAALAGLLVLIIMSLILYKCGFFKREKKEELQRLTQNEVIIFFVP